MRIQHVSNVGTGVGYVGLLVCMAVIWVRTIKAVFRCGVAIWARHSFSLPPPVNDEAVRIVVLL